MAAGYYIVLAVVLLPWSKPVFGEVAEDQAASLPAFSPEAQYDDRITLKSGKVLQGGKIVRTTPFKLFLEILPAIEPLEIPTRQVVAISYGQPKAKAGEDTTVAQAEEADEPSHVLPATKVSPDLVKRMTSPIAEEALTFNEQDLLNTLRSAGILSGVSVTFGPKFEDTPTEERVFSLRLESGTSFEDFFRDTLTPLVPWLNMEYRFDTVHFERK